MKHLTDVSLRARIRRLAVLPVVVITLLLCGYFLLERFSAFERELDIRGQMMARQLAPASEYGVISGNTAVLAGLLAPLLQEADVAFVVIRDHDGSVLVAHFKPGMPADLESGGARLRVYTAEVLRQSLAVDELAAVTSPGTRGASERVGGVEVGMVTDVIAARQREVLLQAMLLAAVVLAGTLLVASRTADAVVRIEEARVSAEHASNAKSEFLAMMSHELRTPMNGVLGMLELLEGSALDGDQRHCLDTARRSSEHLLVVIDDILDFSRIEGGRLAIERIEFELADLLETLADGFAVSAASRGIGLELVVDERLRGLLVTSDPTRLRQVLVNLVGNAVKFTERGSVVIRASGAVEVPGLVDLRIEVADTGIGIAADRIEQMFEPFRQADSSTSRRYGGTGLGLPIARRLTSMLGGVLEVDSEVGVGTRFSLEFRLPCRRGNLPVARVVPRAGIAIEALAGRRALIVEDNSVSQMVAEGMVRSLGMKADIVADGEQAVARLADTRYDVVLMDLQMPRLDGLEATRRLRAGGLATPIVAVTANAFAGERERCLAAGMNEYIAKPFSRDRLCIVLATVLSAPVPAQPPSAG